MISTFEEFCKYYSKYGRCPNQLAKPNHCLTERELQSKWSSYQKAQTKQSTKQTKGTYDDSKWVQVCEEVDRRDRNKCRFLSKLLIDNPGDYRYIIQTCPCTLIQKLDHAHIISRSESAGLYYEKDNIILLSRVIHSRIDQYLHPITGRSITSDERDSWWKYIISEELFCNLQDRK